MLDKTDIHGVNSYKKKTKNLWSKAIKEEFKLLNAMVYSK